MKRQRGRNRGGGSPPNGGKPQNANRAFDSNGPDNIKVRGHAQHVLEKYQQLARDATSSGDRVLAENFLQHAEHYFRVLRTIQPNRPIADFIARETFASGYDIDFEDESGAQALPDELPETSDSQNDGDASRGDYQQRDSQSREPRQDRWENRGDRQQRDGQQRDGQQRDTQSRDTQPRDGQPRDGQSRDGQPRDGQQPRENRDRNFRDRDRDRPRYEGESEQPRAEGEGGYRQQPREARDRDRYRDDRGPREDRPPREDRQGQGGERRERSFERAERSDPLAVVEPQAQPLTQAPAPEVSMLRSHDGETSHAPAFLQAAPAPAATAAEAPVKRPRGRPKKAKEEASTEEA